MAKLLLNCVVLSNTIVPHKNTFAQISAAGAGEVVIIDKPTGYNSIMNMQDMTDTVCKGAAIGTSGKLRDIRDNKVYWVTRLADGNCWMTQNLDLDLSDEINLTSADTDINTAWTPITTQTSKPAFSNSTNTVQSFDPGYYLYTTPSTQNTCSGASLAGCGGWVNVYTNATWRPSSDPNFTVPFDNATNTYNSHYLIGNYYSWGAATAGQAASLTSTSAGQQSTQSICPKGWQLPINSGDKSYNTLLTSYGTNSGLSYGTQDIRLNPLYFVYGGYVDGSSLYNAGSNGYYWSSMVNNASSSYSLNFDTSVNPSYNASRYSGFSVRCVAR